MKSLKKKRRIQVLVAAAVALVVAVAMIGYAFRDGINYFRAPSQLATEPVRPNEVFRLGGLVAQGSIKRDPDGTIHFAVTDGGATVPARFNGVLPDLFKEGQGMVGTGKMEDGVFVASEILAKHDENYMPKEVVDALKEQGVYEPPKS
ncbi:cytochrome c maturation protein CcmE [Thioclava sp. GXIMD4216]|uniref:cytochrome c maturation protein CcmE n=1 Tax=unclassified Thioclava TaxID=2621713 RepID=UPI0030CAF95E